MGGQVFLGFHSVQVLGSMLFLGFSILPSYNPPGIIPFLGLRELKLSVRMGLVLSGSFRSFGLCSLPGSPVHGIPQLRILQWAAIFSSRGPSPPGDQTCISCVSCIAGESLPAEPAGKSEVERGGRIWLVSSRPRISIFF